MKKYIFAVISIMLCISLCGCAIIQDFNSVFNGIVDYIDLGNETVIMDERVEVYRVDPKPIDDNEIEFLFCYKQLNSEQKRIYKIMYSAIEDMQKGWIELKECKKSYSSDIAVAYQALSYDHPELFWMPYTYLLSNTEKGEEARVFVAFSYSKSNYSSDYLVSNDEKDKMKTLLENKISELVESVEGKSLYESELYFHNYLCSNTVYTKSEQDPFVYTAYGALINGKAVCEGYSRAMQLLCKRAGIECTVIAGTADGEKHMWNLVDSGDGWYHTDVTWDDTEKPYNSYAYFNLNDTQISATHVVSPHFSTIINEKISLESNINIVDFKCTNNTFNYFAHEGLILDESNLDNAAEKILFANKENSKNLQFKFENEAYENKFNENFSKEVAKIQNKLYLLGGKNAPIIQNITLIGNTVIMFW